MSSSLHRRIQRMKQKLELSHKTETRKSKQEEEKERKKEKGDTTHVEIEKFEERDPNTPKEETYSILNILAYNNDRYLKSQVFHLVVVEEPDDIAERGLIQYVPESALGIREIPNFKIVGTADAPMTQEEKDLLGIKPCQHASELLPDEDRAVAEKLAQELKAVTVSEQDLEEEAKSTIGELPNLPTAPARQPLRGGVAFLDANLDADYRTSATGLPVLKKRPNLLVEPEPAEPLGAEGGAEPLGAEGGAEPLGAEGGAEPLGAEGGVDQPAAELGNEDSDDEDPGPANYPNIAPEITGEPRYVNIILMRNVPITHMPHHLYDLELTDGRSTKRVHLNRGFNHLVERSILRVGDNVDVMLSLEKLQFPGARKSRYVLTVNNIVKCADKSAEDEELYYWNIERARQTKLPTYRDMNNLPQASNANYYMNHIATNVPVLTPQCSVWKKRFPLKDIMPVEQFQKVKLSLKEIRKTYEPIALQILNVKNRCIYEKPDPSTLSYRGLVKRQHYFRTTVLCVDCLGVVCQVQFPEESNVTGLRVFQTERFIYLEKYRIERRDVDDDIPVTGNRVASRFDIVVDTPKPDYIDPTDPSKGVKEPFKPPVEFVFSKFPTTEEYQHVYYPQWDFKFLDTVFEIEGYFSVVGLVLGVGAYERRREKDHVHRSKGEVSVQNLVELIDSTLKIVRVLLNVQCEEYFDVHNAIRPGNVIVLTNLKCRMIPLIESTDYTQIYVERSMTDKYDFFSQRQTEYLTHAYLNLLESLNNGLFKPALTNAWIGGPSSMYFPLFDTFDELLDYQFSTSPSHTEKERNYIESMKKCYKAGMVLFGTDCPRSGESCHLHDFRLLISMLDWECRDFAFYGTLRRVGFYSQYTPQPGAVRKGIILEAPDLNSDTDFVKVYFGCETLEENMPFLPRYFYDGKHPDQHIMKRVFPVKTYRELLYACQLEKSLGYSKLPDQVRVGDDIKKNVCIVRLRSLDKRTWIYAVVPNQAIAKQLFHMMGAAEQETELLFIIDMFYSFKNDENYYCSIRQVFRPTPTAEQQAAAPTPAAPEPTTECTSTTECTKKKAGPSGPTVPIQNCNFTSIVPKKAMSE